MRAGAVWGTALALLLLGWATRARADSQWNASLLTGVCGTGTHSELWQDTCWYNGLRGDVLFGRSRNSDAAVGPFVDFTTAGFEDLRIGGGASVLVPVHPYFPLAVSAGAYARKDDPGWEPGLAGWLFWGSRSYNFHASYGIAGGLLAGLQYGLGDSHETAIVITAQIDGQLLLLPFLAGYHWLRGPPDD